MGMGLLAFTADGRMMAMLSDGRPGPIDGARAFVSYCGDYTFDGARLVTQVDGASDPVFFSEPQVREASLEGAASPSARRSVSAARATSCGSSSGSGFPRSVARDCPGRRRAGERS